jgi:hypothetical protein
MRKRRSVTWLWILFGPVSWIVLALATAVLPSSGESVRQELIRRQAQTGLSLASLGSGLNVDLFHKRTLVQVPISTGLAFVRGTISRDGTEIILSRLRASASDSLELLQTDGSDTRELPFTYAGTMLTPVQSLCWSYDKSRLAVAVYRGSPDVKLEILNLGSGVDQTVAPSVKELTSQCWSPDDKKIVYEAATACGSMRLETISPQPPLPLGERSQRGHPTETGSHSVRAIRSTKSVPTAETRGNCSIAETCTRLFGGRRIRAL